MHVRTSSSPNNRLAVVRTGGFQGRTEFTAAGAISRRSPWRGRSPWALCPLTCKLMASLERQLGDEAAGASGYILPVPKPSDALAADVKGGNVVLGETMTDAWGSGPGQGRGGGHDWHP